MRTLLISIVSAVTVQTAAQNPQLADTYFENKEYDKALAEYRELYKRSPQRLFYLRMYQCHLELKEYKEAATLAEKHLQRTNEPEGIYLADVAFAKARMGDSKAESKIINRILESIAKNPQNAYQVGQALSDKGYFEAALRTYEIAEKANPSFNFTYQKALLYADLGQLEKMYDAYIEILERTPSMAPTIKSLLARAMAAEGGEDDLSYIASHLYTRAFQLKNPVMADVLTFIYTEKNDYPSALAFLKEWHQRTEFGTIGEIYQLALHAIKQQDYHHAIDALTWVLSHTTNASYLHRATLALHEARARQALDPQWPLSHVQTIIDENQKLLQTQGLSFNTSSLAEATAKLMAQRTGQKTQALELIESLVKLPGQPADEKARLLMLKGDIYLSMKEPMIAIVAYARAEEIAESETLKDNAKLARARAIYYNGDIPWALEIFEILQESTSKPTSNQASYYASKIMLNSGGDTTYEAMTLYAHADMFYHVGEYQNTHKILDYIINTYTNHPIQDDAYLLKAMTYEAQGHYQQAVEWYERIYTIFGYDLLADQAIYKAAVLHQEKLNNPRRAIELLELIVLEFTDSFLHHQARMRLRTLLSQNPS
ncbi:tetratricopeptide repeat protein [Schleiferia thermophila]|uniref:tetratricopeptide repeat protein n=1 Tax=Schleiferia thermophila TaxID=884107 RepID=UPI003EEA3D2F